MPRSRASAPTRRRKKKSGRVAGGRPTPTSKPNLNIDDVLAAAQHEMENLNIPQALKLYTSAASLLRTGNSPSTGSRERQLLHVLEKLSEIKVGSGDQEGALKDLQEALRILEEEYPDGVEKDVYYYEGRSTFTMYLGQLCSEDQALEAYDSGIQSLETCIKLISQVADDAMEEENETDDADDEMKPPTSKALLADLQQRLSAAYCTAAELFLTDLCFADQAEERCESYLKKALAIKDESTGQPMPDALQTMGSLRLSQQGKQTEAIPFMLRTYQGMKKGCDALASLVGLIEEEQGIDGSNEDDQALELKDVDAANNLPEFEFRCQSSKLLLECAALDGANTEEREKCIHAAISVLGSLLAQNDEVIEIWYLTGCAFCAQQPATSESKDSARHYLARAMEMLIDTQKALKQQQQHAEDEEEDEIEEQLEEMACQIEDVQAKLEELGGEEDSETMED